MDYQKTPWTCPRAFVLSFFVRYKNFWCSCFANAMVDLCTVRASVIAWGMLSLICSMTFTQWAPSIPVSTLFKGFIMLLFVIVWTFPVKRERSKNRVSEAVAWTQMAVAWTLISLLRIAFLTIEEHQSYCSHLFWFVYLYIHTYIYKIFIYYNRILNMSMSLGVLFLKQIPSKVSSHFQLLTFRG